MPTFGQHETAQRLFLSGVGALYALKADDKKVIKVLQPPAGIWSDEQVHDEIAGFLLHTKAQQALATSSKCWAPIYEVAAVREGTEGSSGGGADVSQGGDSAASGAYAIMDRYERSVQSLIDGRVNLNNDDLRNVMTRIIQGLLDARGGVGGSGGEGKGRPHGNLKPSNILLTKSADLANATVHLTDPAPEGPAASVAAAERKDLLDLARILYQLVNLRPYQGGTIGRTKDWDELGPNGEDWRKLCNTLLDTAAPPEALDLAKILASIDTWRAKPKKSKTPLLIAASVFLVLVVGGGAAYFLTRPPKLAFDQPAWEKLCLSYYTWFGDFSDRFADDAFKRNYTAAPYPTEIVKLITDAGKDFDKYQPKKIARKPSSASELAVTPTDDAKTGYGPYYTKKGVELIDGVAAALTPDQWPLLKDLDTTAKKYQDRGWLKPAAGIRTIIAGARPPPYPESPPDIALRVKAVQPVDVAARIDNTILASKSVTDIDARWARIQELLKQLPSTDVPLLKALPKFAEDLPRSQLDPAVAASLADVTSLAASFTQVEQLVTQLVADLTPRPGHEIVFAELARDPAVQVPADAKPGLERYTALPALARGYVKLATDPRASVDWTRSLADIQKQMIDVIREANPRDANLPILIQHHAGVQKNVAAFASIAPIEKNHAELDRLVGVARTDLASLTGEAQGWVAPYIIDPAAYIAEQRARVNASPLAKAAPSVYAEWQKAHKALLAKIEADPAQLKKYLVYKAVDAKFTTLEKIYSDFDTGKIPARVPGLSEITGTDWRHTIAARVATDYRENALRDIMTNPALKWSDDLPQVEDAAYVSYQRQRLADYERTRTDTLALLRDYAAIIDRFDHLYLLPDEPTAGTKSWRDLYITWQQSRNALLSDNVIAAALKPVADRVNALLALDVVSDYPGLLANSTSSAAEIALTAWRKLGSAPISEDLPVLDDEDKAEAALTAQLTTLARARTIDDARLQRLSAEIAAQRPVRWHRWADTLSSPAAIQTALDRADSFKVTLTPQSNPALVYNRLYYALRKEFDKNLKEAELKPITQNFINSVNALPDSVSKDRNIQELLARMAKPLQQSEVESSSAGAGPKLAGWEQDNSRPDIRLFYFPNKAAPRFVLEFLRVQVNQKTIFICSTEMSVGLFADTLNGAAVSTPAKFADVDNTGKPAAQAHWFRVPARQADDIWSDLGPRAWRISDHKFVLNTTWLSETAAQMIDKSYYPDGGKPAAPSPGDPMQLLSPWSAMYASRLLGCRLPTSDEWKAAYDKFEVSVSGGGGAPNALPKDVWNLRGEAPPVRPNWRSEQDYAQKMASLGMKYPDQGIFLTPDFLFAGITGQAAKPWKADALAKLAPARITPSADAYKGSWLWFRPVGNQPGTSPVGSGSTGGGMHDLVGNVAEYVFDGPNAVAVIKDNAATTAAIDAAVAAARKSLFVIGGSSLSPPDLPFNQKQELDPGFPQTTIGYCDVGFRLAYTAPIDSIVDVLAATFKDPKYLPGPRAKAPG